MADDGTDYRLLLHACSGLRTLPPWPCSIPYPIDSQAINAPAPRPARRSIAAGCWTHPHPRHPGASPGARPRPPALTGGEHTPLRPPRQHRAKNTGNQARFPRYRPRTYRAELARGNFGRRAVYTHAPRRPLAPVGSLGRAGRCCAAPVASVAWHCRHCDPHTRKNTVRRSIPGGCYPYPRGRRRSAPQAAGAVKHVWRAQDSAYDSASRQPPASLGTRRSVAPRSHARSPRYDAPNATTGEPRWAHGTGLVGRVEATRAPR